VFVRVCVLHPPFICLVVEVIRGTVERCRCLHVNGMERNGMGSGFFFSYPFSVFF